MVSTSFSSSDGQLQIWVGGRIKKIWKKGNLQKKSKRLPISLWVGFFLKLCHFLPEYSIFILYNCCSRNQSLLNLNDSTGGEEDDEADIDYIYDNLSDLVEEGDMDTIREALEEESRRKKNSSTGRTQGARPSAATLNVLDIANETLETHYNELAGMEGEGANSESDEDEESTRTDIQAPTPGMATNAMVLQGYL